MWLALLACAGLAQDPAQDPATGTVVGRIEDVNGDHAAGDWLVELKRHVEKPVYAKREDGEFRFEGLEPGSALIGAACRETGRVIELQRVEIEAGAETYVILEDDASWVGVELIDARTDDHSGRYGILLHVTVRSSDGRTNTEKFTEASGSMLVYCNGDPPYSVRLEGLGFQTVDVQGIAGRDSVELAVRSSSTVTFEGQDEVSRRLLEGAMVDVSPFVPKPGGPEWRPLGESINLAPGYYSIAIKLGDGQVLWSHGLPLNTDEAKVIPLKVKEGVPLRLHLPFADDRTEVRVDVHSAKPVSSGDYLFEYERGWQTAGGTHVELTSFPLGVELMLSIRYGPWFVETHRIAAHEDSVQTFQPGPMAFVEVSYEHEGQELGELLPGVRISTDGRTSFSTAAWDQLCHREPVPPGRVSVGLRRGGASSFLPAVEVGAGEVAHFPTIRVSEWLPTRCPMTVTIDGEIQDGGFSVYPHYSSYTWDGKQVLGVTPGQVEILIYDRAGTWVYKPEVFELDPGDRRQLHFSISRITRRVRFLDRDGDPLARRRILVKRLNTFEGAREWSSRIKTDEDGYAEVRLTPGTLTFSRLGRSVTVDWPIETDTLTLK